MGWGDATSAELDARGQGSFPAGDNSERNAVGKIASRAGSDCENSLIRKRGFFLDMGEGSREQGFKLNGCR